jgi:hypothetical protein
MTLAELATNIVNDPAYREGLMSRARAGTLPESVESLLLEMADGRTPMSATTRAPAQSPTLALIRSSAVKEEDV